MSKREKNMISTLNKGTNIEYKWKIHKNSVGEEKNIEN